MIDFAKSLKINPYRPYLNNANYALVGLCPYGRMFWFRIHSLLFFVPVDESCRISGRDAGSQGAYILELC